MARKKKEQSVLTADSLATDTNAAIELFDAAVDDAFLSAEIARKSLEKNLGLEVTIARNKYGYALVIHNMGKKEVPDYGKWKGFDIEIL